MTFLDSHIEVTKGWLEPLLDRLAESPANVAVPVIDVISDKTLAYNAMMTPRADDPVNIGGFNWGMIFTWHMPPPAQKAARASDTSPLRSPASRAMCRKSAAARSLGGGGSASGASSERSEKLTSPASSLSSCIA